MIKSIPFRLLFFLILIITVVRSESSSGKCGKGIGSCKKGECCSKYGWCGKTDDYCGKGCQSEFGKCKSTSTTVTTTTTKTKTPTPTPTNRKCGKGIGSCKKGECCSKYGWCGKTDAYCGKGCQSEFGKCKSTSTTVTTTTTTTKTKTPTPTPANGKCGKGIGSCKKGECCSKYGWCGKSNDHCEISKGCQSEFGICNKEGNNNENPVNNSTVVSNSNFDFSFLKLENNKKNMLYSPLSIKYALKMLEEGANGNTYDEINKVVGNEELPKYTSIDEILSLANGLFIRDTYYEHIKKTYIDTLKEKYDAEVVKDKFKDAQNANKWIEDKTLGIIKDMLQDDIVQNPLSVMLIINALAIDMEWVRQFSYEETHGGMFYMENGQGMEATMMSQSRILSKVVSYYIGEDVTALTMDLKDYNGTQFEFMAIMPKENLSGYIENVSKEQIDKINKKLKLASDEKGGVNIVIPKFKFNYDLKLKEDLIDLGIKDAFDGDKADFSKMEDSKELFVSDALHKADIEFTEKGVKAAAVTVFAVRANSAPIEDEPVDVIINKPFMFIVRDKNTKNVWFTGTVYKPNSWENDKESYEPSYGEEF